MVRVLLVANKTPGSQEISEFVKSRMQTEGCRFTVLVPATQRNEPEPTWLARSVSGDWAGPQWTQEAEDNYAHARARLEYGLDLLRSWGAAVDGQVGDPDPGKAIKAAPDVPRGRQVRGGGAPVTVVAPRRARG